MSSTRQYAQKKSTRTFAFEATVLTNIYFLGLAMVNLNLLIKIEDALQLVLLLMLRTTLLFTMESAAAWYEKDGTDSPKIDNLNYWDKNKLCNCKNFDTCDVVQGGCESGCNKYWGGKLCQHFQMTSVIETLPQSFSRWSKLFDALDSTCENHNEGAYEFTLGKSYHFIQIYLVSKSDLGSETKVTIHNGDGSHRTTFPGPKLYRVVYNSQKIAIKARSNYLGTKDLLYTTVTIENVPGVLCTVDLSAGRNIALKMKSEGNLTTAAQNEGKYTPGSALDGAVDVEDPKCFTSPTTKPGKEVYYKIIFETPSVINYLSWWGTKVDTQRYQMIRYYLFYLDEENKRIQAFKDEHQLSPDRASATKFPWEIQIDMRSERKILSVLFTINKTSYNSDVKIAICEVYILGEIICPAGFSGAPCARCNETFYGEDCLVNCPQTCMGRKCDHISGRCKGCVDGQYGDQCNLTCPSTCTGNTCKQGDGNCTLGCQDGYYDTFCDLKCGEKCKNSLCDKNSGKCSGGCKDGYEGDTCSTKKVPSLMVIVLGLLILIVILSIVAFLIIRNKGNHNQSMEQQEMKDEHDPDFENERKKSVTESRVSGGSFTKSRQSTASSTASKKSTASEKSGTTAKSGDSSIAED